jgi:copper homeostasis protein
MIAAVKERAAIPVFVIIRPRGGGFVYTDDEIDVMHRDLIVVNGLDADGVVIGALRENATIDVVRVRELVEAAAPVPVTFHRAFDLVVDRHSALEALIEAGVSRLLTSGGAATALAGADAIGQLVAQAAGRIVIMAGGGIREETASEIVRRSGVHEIHVRGTRVVTTAMTPASGAIRLRKALPEDEGAWEETDETRVRRFVEAANS